MEDLLNIESLMKRRNIATLQCIAQSEGLESHIILKLVDAIGVKKLCLSKKKKLVQCIIPKDSVPEDALLIMTSYVTDYTFEMELKVEILKWIIAALPFSSDTPYLSKFNCLYENFLLLLKQEVLRPYVIYLLRLVTIKHHVTLARLEYVVELQYEHDLPCFKFLLRMLSGLQPKLVEGTFLDFKPPFNDDGLFDIYPDLKTEMDAYKSSLNISPRHTSLKRKFKESPPVSLNSDDPENMELNSDDTDPENIDSFHFDVDVNFEKELPDPAEEPFEELYKCILRLNESSMKNILSSDFRRLLFTSHFAPIVQTSFFDYMLTSFWYSSGDFNSTLPVILEILHEIQEPMVQVADFMKDIIAAWDGHSNFHTVLEILCFHQIGCFDGKVAVTLDPLVEMMKEADVIHKCHFLQCYTRIYQNWASLKFSDDDYIICRGDCSLSKDISGNQGYHLPVNEIYAFGIYIDTICDYLVGSGDFHPCLLNQVLRYYQNVSASHSENENLILHLPTDAVFISSLFCLNSSTLESLCQLMLGFHAEVFSETKENHPERDLAKHYFKSCLFDVGNILWLNREYKSQECTYLSRTEVFKTICKHYPTFINKFTVYMHPALVLNAVSFCNQFSIKPSSIKHIPEIEQYIAGLSDDGLSSCAYIINFFLSQ